MRGSYRRGFTLVELLVTIAIVALLAAILLPVLAAGREKSCQASCSSNARQLALGLLLYAQDYDGRVMDWADNDAGDPGCDTCDPDPGHFLAWYDGIQPYVRSRRVLRCPSYGGAFPVPDGWPIQNRFMASTYALSGKLIWKYRGDLAHVQDPSGMLMVAETPSGITWFDTYGPGWTCADVLMWQGEMHLVQPEGGTDDWGDPAIRASVTAAESDGRVRTIRMDNLQGGTDGPWEGVSCWNPSW